MSSPHVCSKISYVVISAQVKEFLWFGTTYHGVGLDSLSAYSDLMTCLTDFDKRHADYRIKVMYIDTVGKARTLWRTRPMTFDFIKRLATENWSKKDHN